MASKSPRGIAPHSALAALLYAPLVLLTACGGGGGGDGGSDPASAVQLTITDTNAPPVAGEAVGIAQQGSEVADLGGSLATGAQVDARQTAAGPVALGAAGMKLLALRRQAPALAVGVTQTETFPCDGGGTLTATITGSDGAAAIPGDSLRISASNCLSPIIAAERMNGVLTLTVTAGSYDPESQVYPKDVTLRMQAANFSMDTVTLNGTVDLHVVLRSDPADSTTLTSPSFSWTQATSSGSHSVTLSNYSHRVDRNSVGVHTTSVSATVVTDSARIQAGRVSFELSTPTPIISDFRGVVSAGSLQVTGKSSALRLTGTAADTFSLQVDTNGDGTFETTRTVLRSQF